MNNSQSMTASDFFGNGTTIMNRTAEFDYFCVKLLVGPLVWAAFTVPCGCVCLAASVWLLWVLVQRQRSTTSGASYNNVYMLNLSLLDFTYNIVNLAGILNFFVWRDLHFWQLHYFFQGLNFHVRPLLMASSCVDCYIAVVHPIMYMKTSQYRYREVICGLIYVLTLVFGLLYHLVIFTRWVRIYVYNIPCVLAISTITFCDIVTLRTLRKPDPSGRNDVHPQKQKALQTIINSFIMTLVSYLPLLLLMLLQDVIPLDLQELFCHVLIPSIVCSVIGITILPLLHLRNLGRLNALKTCDCI